MNLFKEPEITFDEKLHKYHCKKTGKELISCTTLIHKFTEEFDKDGSILTRCATRENIPEKELKQRWEDEKNRACEYGISVHKQIENYLNTGKIANTPDKDIVKQFSKIKYDGKLMSEVKLYNLELGIAGTADLLCYKEKTNSVKIGDFKTNKKLNRMNPWGKKMLSPLQHYDDCNFNTYIIQMNVYAYLLELAGIWVDDNSLELIYVNPKTRKLELYQVPDVRKDVIKMIDYWKNPNRKELSREDSYKKWVEDLFDFSWNFEKSPV